MEVRGQKSEGLRRFWQIILFIRFFLGMTIVRTICTALIGVVAALALVPAIAAAGIAFLSKNPVMGFGGLLLLSINVGFIIISGILTIIIMRPEQRD